MRSARAIREWQRLPFRVSIRGERKNMIDPALLSSKKLDDSFITELEAVAILREKSQDIHQLTIQTVLSELAFQESEPEFITFEGNNCIHVKGLLNIPDEDGTYKTRHFLKKDIDDLVIDPEFYFISFQNLIKRPPWGRYAKIAEKELLNFLRDKNKDQELKVFDPVHFLPRHEENGGFIGVQNGSSMFEKRPVITGFYGEDARALINEKKGLFCLADITVLEEKYLPKSQTEEVSENSTTCVEEPLEEDIESTKLAKVELLLNEELKKIKEGKATPPKNQKAMIEKIYKTGKQRGWFMGESNKEISTLKKYVFNQVDITTSDLILEKGETRYSRLLKELKKGMP